MILTQLLYHLQMRGRGKKVTSNKPKPYIHDRSNQIGRMFNLLGPNVPAEIKKNIKFDDEAAWSFTNQQIANDLCVKLLTLPQITPDSVITDATASVGGNTIAFAKHFAHVNSIELNQQRAEMLEHNIKLFKLTNVTIVNDYAQNVIPTLTTNVLFVDPPWAPAGVNYKDAPTGTLKINLTTPSGEPQSFEDFLLEMSQYTEYVVCKLPTNYDFTHLETTLSVVYNIVDKTFHGRPNTSAVYIMRVK